MQERLERNIKNTRWTPLYENGKNAGGRNVWKMRCECGIEKDVQFSAYKNGRSLSCGCYARDLHKVTGGQNRKPLGESSRQSIDACL